MDKHLIHRDYQDFLELMELGRTGGSTFIKNSLKKVDNVFNIMQSRFTLLGSTSGAGKSSFIDDVFILKPWRDRVIHETDMKWEVNYYSMERKKLFKHARWLSWLLYVDKGWLVPVDALLGWDVRGKLSDPIYEVVRQYNEELSMLLDQVQIYDGRTTSVTISRHVHKKARTLGILYTADSVGVLRDDELTYLVKFDVNKTRTLRNGTKEMYVELEHKGAKFTLVQDTHKYFLHNPNTYFHIVLDGLGLIGTEGFENTKQAVDNVVNVLADARDVYGFSPIIVSQFNRGIANIERLKHHGANMGPQESDFKDSGNAYQAADLALAIFDPFKFKAYDKQGLYGGYDIVNGMVAPQGHCRFRSLHVLKNTFGIDNAVFGMRYTGESSYFETLPKGDSIEIHDVYSKIAQGL